MRGRAFIFGVIAAVCIGSGVRENAHAALAEDWKEYRNERFGLSLYYPADVFMPDRTTEAGDGQLFVSQIGNARLLVGGLINDSGHSPASYQGYLARESYSQYQIDYRPIGQNWFVLSGEGSAKPTWNEARMFAEFADYWRGFAKPDQSLVTCSAATFQRSSRTRPARRVSALTSSCNCFGLCSLEITKRKYPSAGPPG